MHQHAMQRLRGVKRAGQGRNFETRGSVFLTQALSPLVQLQQKMAQLKIQVDREHAFARTTTRQLAQKTRELGRETALRRAAEENFGKSEGQYRAALAEAKAVHSQMRSLARQALSVQEDERKEISRELHDQIAQPLAGINVHLSSLKEAAKFNTRGLNQKIAATQRLIAQSYKTVHHFARQLRPAALDDLGLISALRSYIHGMPIRRSIRISFRAPRELGEVDGSKSIALYRVAQEALVNISRHAHATRATVTIRKVAGIVRLEVADNGRSFRADRVVSSKRSRRLGLIGMRERIEMVGGTFAVFATPGRGTIISAEVPLL